MLMKRPNKLQILAIIICSVATGQQCRKEVAYVSRQVETNTQVRLCNLLAPPLDSEDANMNDQLYMLLEGLKDVVANPSLLSGIYGEISHAPGHEIAYGELIGLNSDYKTKINERIRPQYFPGVTSSFDCYTHIDDQMIYKGLDYYPNLSILNYDTANLALNPIICMGANVDDADNIFGFALGLNNTFTSVVITEQMATYGSVPVIIINNGTGEIDNSADSLTTTTSPGIIPTSSSSQYEWDEWLIQAGYRYESGGPTNKSEVNFIVTIHNNTSTFVNSSAGFPSGERRGHVADVWENDINNSAWNSSPNPPTLFSQTLSSTYTTSYPYAYITTYEFDWYASKKTVRWCLDNDTNFLVSVYHECKMKYANEWYTNDVCEYNLTSFMPSVNSVAGWGGWKSTFRLKRI
jgi:hypothetical protein